MKCFQNGKFVSLSVKKIGRSHYRVHVHCTATERDAFGIALVKYVGFVILKGDRDWALWNAKHVEVARDTTAQALINVLVHGNRESVEALAEQESAAR